MSTFASKELPLDSIGLTLNITPIGDGVSIKYPKVPVNPPVVYIDGHTVVFDSADFCDYVLIIDLNTEEIKYNTMVSECTTEVLLPLYLLGKYEIRFCRGIYYFSGIITLF